MLAFCIAIVTGIILRICIVVFALVVPHTFVARATCSPPIPLFTLVRVSVDMPLTTGVVAAKPLLANHDTVVAAGVPLTVAAILKSLPAQINAGGAGEEILRVKTGAVFIVIVLLFMVEQPFAAVIVTV